MVELGLPGQGERRKRMHLELRDYKVRGGWQRRRTEGREGLSKRRVVGQGGRDGDMQPIGGRKEGRQEGRGASMENNQNRNGVVGWGKVNQDWERKAEEYVPLVTRISLVRAY